MKEIPLSRGFVTLVDDADYDELVELGWYASKKGYAVRNDGRKKEFLSRRLLGLDYGDPRIAEHRSGDKFDNRRANLRIATPGQNMYNTKRRSDNTSGVKGVTWDRANNKWRAQLSAGRKKVNIGRFAKFEDAVAARQAAAIEHHGEFARHG